MAALDPHKAFRATAQAASRATRKYEGKPATALDDAWRASPSRTRGNAPRGRPGKWKPHRYGQPKARPSQAYPRPATVLQFADRTTLFDEVKKQGWILLDIRDRASWPNTMAQTADWYVELWESWNDEHSRLEYIIWDPGAAIELQPAYVETRIPEMPVIIRAQKDVIDPFEWRGDLSNGFPIDNTGPAEMDIVREPPGARDAMEMDLPSTSGAWSDLLANLGDLIFKNAMTTATLDPDAYQDTTYDSSSESPLSDSADKPSDDNNRNRQKEANDKTSGENKDNHDNATATNQAKDQDFLCRGCNGMPPPWKPGMPLPNGIQQGLVLDEFGPANLMGGTFSLVPTMLRYSTSFLPRMRW